jgi:hypothetical protein
MLFKHREGNWKDVQEFFILLKKMLSSLMLVLAVCRSTRIPDSAITSLFIYPGR